MEITAFVQPVPGVVSSDRQQRRRLLTKTLLVMKLTIVFLTAAFLHVNAKGLAQNVTYSGSNVPLEKVFAALEKQTGYYFLYADNTLAGVKPITVTARDLPLNKFLALILKDQPLKYTVSSKSVLITRIKPVAVSTHPSFTGDTTKPVMILEVVSGRVTDDAGAPVPGASIFTRGRTTMVSANGKGEFILKQVALGDTLIFTSVNHVPKRVEISGPEMNVVLRRAVMNLKEVTIVQTGFQTINKERATGSFGKPDMEVVQKRTSSMDLLTRLEGQVPGLTLEIGLNNSTANQNGNGNTTRKVLVRGRTTVQAGTEPLYVVNGVIVPDISSINLDDIDDLTVLKDAAAAAIWGAKAANGVIVITTKTGVRSQRVSINYSGFLNYTPVGDLGYGKAMNGRQLVQTGRELFNPVVNPYSTLVRQSSMPHEKILYEQSLGRLSETVVNRKLDSLAALDNMGQIEDLFYQPTITNNHTISASGGSGLYSFYASLGYTGSQSSTPGEKSNTYRLNFTQSLTAGSRVKLTVSASLINNVGSRKNMPNVQAGFAPYQLFQDAAGNNLPVNWISGWSDSLRQNYQDRSRINLDYIPLNEVDLAYSKSNNLSINLTANAQVRIWKGLSFIGTYGYLKAPGSSESYQDAQTISYRKQALSLTVAPTLSSIPVYNLPMTGGVYTRAHNDQRNYTVRNQLAYEGNARNGKDHFSLQLGNDIQESTSFSSSFSVPGYDRQLGSYPQLDYARLASGVSGTITGFGSYGSNPLTYRPTISRFISYFALASYSFDEKYSLDASWRQDYSSLFGKNLSKQNKPTYSLGGKWRIKQENFMKSVTWLNDLGIRVTHGIVGNSPTASGASTLEDILRVVTNSAFSPAPAGNALTLGSPANKNLSWEKTHTTNVGIDFAVLKSRISGNIELYQKNTSDLIGPFYVNALTGFDLVTGNFGKMVNKGIEMSLRTVNIAGKDFSWFTTLNIAFNKNKIVEYYQSASALTGAVPSTLGYDSRGTWAYRYAGLDNLGDPQVMLSDGKVTKEPFVTLGKDQVYQGTTQPRVSGGLANTFQYKGFSLALNAVFNLGAVMRREAGNTSIFSGRSFFSNTSLVGNNLPAWFNNRWKQPGDEAFTNIPSYVASSSDNRRRNLNYYFNSDANIISASYIKLRDITLSYDLQPEVLRFLKIQRASVFVQTSNFMIWKENKDGIDPEVPRQLGAIHPGRSYSLGINLSL